MPDNNTLSLHEGQRLRTAGTSYEVTRNIDVAADIVPVKPQGTRLLKTFCKTCGYTCRVTKRWIDKAGTPICPTCKTSMWHDGKTDDMKPETVEVVEVAPPTLTDDEIDYLMEADDAPEPVNTTEPTTTDSKSPLAQLLADM